MASLIFTLTASYKFIVHGKKKEKKNYNFSQATITNQIQCLPS